MDKETYLKILAGSIRRMPPGPREIERRTTFWATLVSAVVVYGFALAIAALVLF